MNRDDFILNKKNIRYLTKEMIYIGRPYGDSMEHFGNPFSPINASKAAVKVNSRKEAIDNFQKWIDGTSFQDIEPKRRQWILDNLEALRGKRLVCWCSPKECHGDIYLKMLNSSERKKK